MMGGVGFWWSNQLNRETTFSMPSSWNWKYRLEFKERKQRWKLGFQSWKLGMETDRTTYLKHENDIVVWVCNEMPSIVFVTATAMSFCHETYLLKYCLFFFLLFNFDCYILILFIKKLCHCIIFSSNTLILSLFLFMGGSTLYLTPYLISHISCYMKIWRKKKVSSGKGRTF